jgi:hypothetical protein
MKKSLVSALVVAAFSASTAYADDSTGCGFGTIVWDGQSGVAPQVLAVTTNGTLGSQTFGISTGTLGCKQDGTVSSAYRVSMFTGSNMESLARDMSSGQGESLETMAELMEIQEQDKARFFQVSQSNFDKIFTAEDVTAGQVIANLKAVMAADAELAQYSA